MTEHANTLGSQTDWVTDIALNCLGLHFFFMLYGQQTILYNRSE